MTPFESRASLLLLTAMLVGCGGSHAMPARTSDVSASRARAADGRAAQAALIDVADFETFLLDDQAIADQRTPVAPVDAGTVFGPLPKEFIRRVVQRHINEYRFCIERGEAFPAAGAALMTFTIDELGAVTEVTVSGLAADVSSCLVDAVRLWVFPRSDFLTMVRYPITVCATAGGEP